MSEKGHSQQSLKPTNQPMTSGEEPIELLLQLVWSPVETLVTQGKAKVFVGKGAVAIFIHGADLVPHLGLVPTDPEVLAASVGSESETK